MYRFMHCKMIRHNSDVPCARDFNKTFLPRISFVLQAVAVNLQQKLEIRNVDHSLNKDGVFLRLKGRSQIETLHTLCGRKREFFALRIVFSRIAQSCFNTGPPGQHWRYLRL